jgi:hypothetical protein
MLTKYQPTLTKCRHHHRCDRVPPPPLGGSNTPPGGPCTQHGDHQQTFSSWVYPSRPPHSLFSAAFCCLYTDRLMLWPTVNYRFPYCDIIIIIWYDMWWDPLSWFTQPLQWINVLILYVNSLNTSKYFDYQFDSYWGKMKQDNYLMQSVKSWWTTRNTLKYTLSILKRRQNY